ncbi:hypothetical protein [Streptomyces sp. AC602_WCS936]|uniref:hypothetical protein n=1 Tax=Streptomyces sp. AC602_WCS936 TaxID=2823685 RepID=UPI001C25A48B|nr:hypothetical protein [Streptomyces sp. AC602_WCS936]
MTVFGVRAWWQRWRAPAGTGPTADPPGGSGDAEQGPPPLDDCTLKAYAMQRPEWAEALIDVENARVAGEIRLISARLLLGTACGSVLLFSIALATRVAPSLPHGSASPLTTAAIGAFGAALLTALGAGLGRALRGRAASAPAQPVSGGAAEAPRPSERGSERGGGP